MNIDIEDRELKVEKLGPNMYKMYLEGDKIAQYNCPEAAELDDVGFHSITNRPPEELSKEIKEKQDTLANVPTPKEVSTDGDRGEKILKRFGRREASAPKYDDYLNAAKSKTEAYQKIRGQVETECAVPGEGKALNTDNSTVTERMLEAAEKLNLHLNDGLGLNNNNDIGWQDKVVENEAAASVKKTAADMLKESAALYEQRNAVYGDSYKKQGELMTLLFPNGVTLNSVKDFNRFVVFSTILSKILRYSNDFKNPHDDSVLDNITYFAMLRELELDRGE